MRVRKFALALLLSAFAVLPATAGASRYHDDITITPGERLAPNSAYHVAACGLTAGEQYAVDTDGPPPNYPYTRIYYTADSTGCVGWDAITPADKGVYTIDVQQVKLWRLVVVGEHTFTVQ